MLNFKRFRKRPVLSRTITSYFQPQHKIPTSQLSSKASVKSQISLASQEIKGKPKPGYLPQDQLQKRRREMESSPVLLPTVDSKQQSQHPTVFPQESNELSAEQSGPSAVLSRVLCTQKKTKDSEMQTELQEITTLQCQSQKVQNFCDSCFKMQSGKTSLSTRLWTENLEAVQLEIVKGNSPPAPKINAMHNTVILSGESERKEATAKPLIPIRFVNLKRNSTNLNLHSAIISSSNIQEQTIWNANKRYLSFLVLNHSNAQKK